MVKISSCLYGFLAHGAVFLFTGGCMLLAMLASLPFAFLLDRMPDVVYTMRCHYYAVLFICLRLVFGGPVCI